MAGDRPKARGRLFQDEAFVVDELAGARIERLIGCTVDPAHGPCVVLLKARGHEWQRFFVDAGLGFWEEWSDEQVAEDFEDCALADHGAAFGLVGQRIERIQCERGPRIRLAVLSGDVILETTDESVLDAPTRVRFQPRHAGRQSAELELLDQLLGGEMTLAALRPLFASDEHFVRALERMLQDGEVTMLDGSSQPLPSWRAREVLRDGAGWAPGAPFLLTVTERGARRV